MASLSAHLIRIALLLLCAVAATSVHAQKRVALVIGNAAYQHESVLRNPVNDARLMERTLKQELAFDQVLTVTNGTRTQMIRELARFRAAVQGAHTAVVYYSGHGMINGKRQNYVLPVDTPKFAADAASDADTELNAHALSEDDLIEAVEGASDIQVVVLDACRDNGFRGGKSGSKGLARRADQSRNRLIAYATEEGRVAEDGSGSNSTYAASLAKHLARKELPLLTVFDNVARDVEAQTRNKQSPTRSGNLRVDVYLFNPTITVNNHAGPAPVPAPVVRTDPDEEAWKAAQAADSVEGYELYLKDFASGRNVSAAKIKLAAAKRREAAQVAASQPAVARTEPAPAASTSAASSSGTATVGSTLKDCDVCPELVVLPKGSFTMGSPSSEAGRDSDEGPQQRITIDRTLAVGKYEVTQGEWQVVMGGNPSYFKYCGPRCPVEQVSWDEAKEYLRKLNERTGNRYGYRLLSEAEWEYAARAGCTSAFSVSGQCKDQTSTREANFNGNYTYNGSAKGEYRKATIAVGSLNAANAWGLHDMHGNVREWVEDCYVESLNGMPSGGAARTDNCSTAVFRVARGGSWDFNPLNLRTAFRLRSAAGNRLNNVGFRVARTVNF